MLDSKTIGDVNVTAEADSDDEDNDYHKHANSNKIAKRLSRILAPKKKRNNSLDDNDDSVDGVDGGVNCDDAESEHNFSTNSIGYNSIDTVRVSNLGEHGPAHPHPTIHEKENSTLSKSKPIHSAEDQLEIDIHAHDNTNGHKKDSTWKKLKRFVGVNNKKPNAINCNEKSKSLTGQSEAGVPSRAQAMSCDYNSVNLIRTNSYDEAPSRRRGGSVDADTTTSIANQKHVWSLNGDHTALNKSMSMRQQQQENAYTHTNRTSNASGFTSDATSLPRNGATASKIPLSMIDDAVRGRLDGMDVLSLGPPHFSSWQKSGIKGTMQEGVWEHIPEHAFTGKQTKYTTKDMVTDMLWASAGKKPPEIVFDGFFRSDRWFVKVEVLRDDIDRKDNKFTISNNSEYCEDAKSSKEEKKESNATPSTSPESGASLSPSQKSESKTTHQLSECKDQYQRDLSESGHEQIPSHKLWNSMWGEEVNPPPIPSHMTSAENVLESQDVLDYASSYSLPVDVDEDAFIVTNDEHCRTVHDIASVPIQHGKFDDALSIFEKMLKGLEMRETDDLKPIVAVTLHNMAIILMWQGKFAQSLEKIRKASRIRLALLPKDHPGIAVTLVREGIACFALGQLNDAANAFNQALNLPSMDGENNIVKAKILNNLGVVQYQQNDFQSAIKAFNEALEIQRTWLDKPLRRDSIVYDASVILGNTAKIYYDRGDLDLACYAYEEALLLQTSIFSKDHDMVIASLSSVAFAKAKDKQLKQALQIMNGVLRSRISRFGPESCEAIETIGLIACLQFGLEAYEEASEALDIVARWQEQNLNPSHPSLHKTNEFMEKIEKSISTIWI